MWAPPANRARPVSDTMPNHFFVEYHLNRLCEDFDLDTDSIELRPILIANPVLIDNTWCHAYCRRWGDIDGRRVYEIAIVRRLDGDTAIRAIIHEFRHVLQHEEGWLVYHGNQAYWMGQPVTGYATYNDKPQEVDANGFEQLYAPKYIIT
jgi:hypothetical protein